MDLALLSLFARMEMEADYIGLLLMASAGYDPRVAPLVYEKFGEVTGDSPLRDYLSTHPSEKTRAQILAQAKVMEEAMALYREKLAGEWVRGFLQGQFRCYHEGNVYLGLRVGFEKLKGYSFNY